MKIEKYHTFNPDWEKDEIKGRTKAMLKEIGA